MSNINEERLLKEFLEFVQIDSESCNERAMGERLCEVLKELGLEPITDEAGKTYNSNGFNVFARLPGEGEPVGLSAHMDTVVPGIGIKPQIKDGVIYSDGTTILGGDDKSGICAILEAVRVILENNPIWRFRMMRLNTLSSTTSIPTGRSCLPRSRMS